LLSFKTRQFDAANPREPSAGTLIMVATRRNASNDSPSIVSWPVLTLVA
jgi:hypothetical protein